MPHVASVSQTGTGQSSAIKFLRNDSPRVAYQVAVSGTVTYSVQHSLDGTNWVDNGDASGLSSTVDGNYVFPVYGIRLDVTAGAGTATLIVSQALATE